MSGVRERGAPRGVVRDDAHAGVIAARRMASARAQLDRDLRSMWQRIDALSVLCESPRVLVVDPDERRAQWIAARVNAEIDCEVVIASHASVLGEFHPISWASVLVVQPADDDLDPEVAARVRRYTSLLLAGDRSIDELTQLPHTIPIDAYLSCSLAPSHLVATVRQFLRTPPPANDVAV